MLNVLKRGLIFPKSGRRTKVKSAKNTQGVDTSIEESEVARIAGNLLRLASIRAQIHRLEPGSRIEIHIPPRADRISASDIRTAMVPQMSNRPLVIDVFRNKRGKKIAVFQAV